MTPQRRAEIKAALGRLVVELQESCARNPGRDINERPSQTTCPHESWHVSFGIPSCANCGLLQSQIDDAQLVRARHLTKTPGSMPIEESVEPPVEALPDDYYAQLSGAA